MASITNLEAVRARLTAAPAPAEPTAEQQVTPPEQQQPAELYPHELVNIRVTRQCAEWLLLNVDKLRKRLRQSATDPKTRFLKRAKSSAALLLAIQATAAISDTLITDTNGK